MMFPRVSVAGLCVGVFDYVAIATLAAVGTLGWVTVSDMHTPGLTGAWVVFVVVATGLALAWVRVTSARRLWRVTASALVVAAGVWGLLWGWAHTLRLSTGGSMEKEEFWAEFALGVFALGVLGLGLVRHALVKRGVLTGMVRLAVTTGVVGFGIYLAWDEAPAPSIARNRAALAGRFDDEETSRLTLRYSSARDSEKVFAPLTHQLRWKKHDDGRKEFLLAHRAEIEVNWAELTEVRAWCVEMGSRPRLGDRAIESFDQPIMKFQPVNQYVSHGLAMAELRALDGDPDGAMEDILAIFGLGTRLELETATLVRGMIAQVMKKAALTSAEYVVVHTNVSADMRARWAAALEASAGSPEIIKRVILVESEFWSPESVVKIGGNADAFGAPRPWYGRGMGAFVLNPQATTNRVHDYFAALAAMAEARDIEGMRVLDDAIHKENRTEFRLKNAAGNTLVSMIVGSYGGVAKSYWEIEDRRVAVIERLRVGGAGAMAAEVVVESEGVKTR